jgi:hypothetical protein
MAGGLPVGLDITSDWAGKKPSLLPHPKRDRSEQSPLWSVIHPLESCSSPSLLATEIQQDGLQIDDLTAQETLFNCP